MAAPEYGGPAAGPGLLERLSYGAYVARRTGLPVLVSGTAYDVRRPYFADRGATGYGVRLLVDLVGNDTGA